MRSKEEMESIGFKKEGDAYYLSPNDGIVSIEQHTTQMKIKVKFVENKTVITHLVYLYEHEYPVVVFTGEVESIERLKSILNYTIVPRGALYD